MLYLEDFMGLIEDLPSALKDMLTTIGELDLAVQNAMEEQAVETEEFFANATRMQPDVRKAEYDALMYDYGQIVEKADEKMCVAEKLHNLLAKRLGRLDGEIAKFKCKLETEKPGITAVLEQNVANTGVSNKTKIQEGNKSTKNTKKSSANSSSALPRSDGLPPVEAQLRIDNVPVELTIKGKIVSVNAEAAALPGIDTTRYCICNEIAYGDMIACDNPSCAYKWFHYHCVNLITAPEGHWFCSCCASSLQNTSSSELLPAKLSK